jgi:tripartite-type tricarboxylate transporter receptor subunit TctC
MKLPRRTFLHLAAGAPALPALSRIARAQSYPTRSVRIIVGFAAAGPTDFSARLIGQWLSERFGSQFVIENRPGASGNVGTEVVVMARPDGYTLLLCDTTDTVNATLYSNLNFDFIRDIAPVAGIMQGPSVMLVNPSVPAKSVSEFIAYAKVKFKPPMTLDQAVRAAQCRAALEDQLKGSLVCGGDRTQRSDDVPILFDQRLVRQFELPPHLDQVRVRRPIGQAPAPGPCP